MAMASLLYIPSALPWLSRLPAIFQLIDAVLVGFNCATRLSPYTSPDEKVRSHNAHTARKQNLLYVSPSLVP